MKLRDLLTEVIKYSAIAKDSGKLVYFASQKAKDNAVKKGTHEEPKTKSVKSEPTKKKLGKSDFKSGAEKKPAGPISINKKSIPNTDLFNYHEEFLKNVYKNLNGDDIKKMKAQQSDYNEKITNNKNFTSALSMWQEWSDNKARKKMDEIIMKNPPPPIKTDKNLWRGMALEPKQYDKFVKMISSGKDFQLPPSSFSTNPSVSFGFIGMGRQDRDKSIRSVIIKMKSDCGQFSGYYVAPTAKTATIFSGEEEILTQSNSKYSVDSIEELKFEKDRGNLTVLTLIQKCDGLNEGEENVLDLSNSDFMFSLFGPTQKAKE